MTEEILLFDDGIGVKKQKAHRLRLGLKTEPEETRQKNQDRVINESYSSQKKQKRKTVITDIVLLQTPKGSFESLTSPIDNQGQSLISYFLIFGVVILQQLSLISKVKSKLAINKN